MTPPPQDQLQARAASEALVRHGLSGCAATLEGSSGEVLVLRPASDAEETLLQEPAADRLFTELRVLGFRYVTLDLTPREGSG